MILDRIKEYIDFKGIPVSRFEKSIGMSNASFGKSLKSGGAIGTDKLENILTTYTDLSAEWLLTGEGRMLRGGNKDDKKELPLLPFDAVAGFLASNIPDSFAFSEETYSVPEFTERGADFAIRVCGDSMQPKYNNGDILAAKVIKDPSFFQWGRVYVLSTSQGCVVKRLYPNPNDKNLIVCHSENMASFPDYEIPRDEIFAVALVVGHIGAE